MSKSKGRMFGEADRHDIAPRHREKPDKAPRVRRLVVVEEEPFNEDRCNFCGTNTVNGACPNEGEDYPHPPEPTTETSATRQRTKENSP